MFISDYVNDLSLHLPTNSVELSGVYVPFDYYPKQLDTSIVYSLSLSDSVYVDKKREVAKLIKAEFSIADQAIVVNALNSWSAVANVTFDEYESGTLPDLRDIDVMLLRGRLGDFITVRTGIVYTKVYTNTSIWSAPYVPIEISDLFIEDSVDVTIDGPRDSTNQFYGYTVLLHEIGHTLGLSDTIKFNTDYNQDNSLMSVLDGIVINGGIIGDGTTGKSYYRLTGDKPITPMVYDIATVQHHYGVNTTTYNGDTEYYIASDKNVFIFDDGVVEPSLSGGVATIWDAGNSDTDTLKISAPDIDTTGIQLDLRGGFALTQNDINGTHYSIGDQYFSKVGTTTVFLAFENGGRGIIENAEGSNQADKIYGNAIDNELTGNGGDDTIIGFGGSDTIDGGTGFDWLSYENEASGVILNIDSQDAINGGFSGTTLHNGSTDTFTGIEGFVLTTGFDIIYIADSLTFANFLIDGNGGGDELNDGAGSNTLSGDTGNNTLIGNGGVDTYNFTSSNNGRDIVIDDDGVIVIDGVTLSGDAVLTTTPNKYLLEQDGTYYVMSIINGGLDLQIAVNNGDDDPADAIILEDFDFDNGAYGINLTEAGVGEEFQVNSFTSDWQWFSFVTALADGGFVVTWSSTGQDGSNSGVFGQRYNASGNTAGGEFQVNTFTENFQGASSVTGLLDGGFVVTWGGKGQDGSGLGVFGQRYDANGDTFGEEFQVNTFTESDQNVPSVSSLADGGFVVTWSSLQQDGSGTGIYGQRYGADGNKAGGEFQVNTFTESGQNHPSVAPSADGGFVVTWSSVGQDGSQFGHGVFGQRYDANGDTFGEEFLINSYTIGNQRYSVITELADGGFVVTWNSAYQDGSVNGVFGQRYGADGNKAGGEFQVNTFTQSSQEDSSVAALADGGFVVTWESHGQDGSSGGVFGQRYDVDGTVNGAEFQVNSFTQDSQVRPSVSSLADGGFVVTWQSNNQDGSRVGVYGKIFSVAPELPIFEPTNSDPVLAAPISDTTTDEDAALALDVSGNFSDADAADTLTYSAELAGGFLLPSWLIFDEFTGIFSGTPTNDDVGSLTITVTADDGNGGTPASDTFLLTVNNTNDAPELVGVIDDFAAPVGSLFTLDVSSNFTDVDVGDVLIYSSTNLPTWTILDAVTGIISGTPTALDSGSFLVDVIATDIAGETATQSFSIDVANFDSNSGATSGDDILVLGNGSSTIHAGSGNDDVVGGNGTDILYGGSGDDSLQGNNGADIIYGGAGNDTIRGGKGSDTIYGGTGDDVIYGDLGSELIVFEQNSGNDTLINFNPKNDVLDLSDYGFASIDDVMANITYTATDAILQLDANNSITMLDITEADLAKAKLLI